MLRNIEPGIAKDCKLIEKLKKNITNKSEALQMLNLYYITQSWDVITRGGQGGTNGFTGGDEGGENTKKNKKHC